MKLDAAERKLFSIKQADEERAGLDQRWGELEQKLIQKDKRYTKPQLPFEQSILIRDYNTVYYKVYDKVKAIDI